MSIASAIIFGSVFWRMGRSQTSIQDRMGLLQVKLLFSEFSFIKYYLRMGFFLVRVKDSKSSKFDLDRLLIDIERWATSFS